MNDIVSNSLFGIGISLGAFIIGDFLYKKFKVSVLNPLLTSIAIVIIFLQVSGISLEAYNIGGDAIAMFLAPATTVLAYSIYKQAVLLKKYFIPIAVGCLAGSITSMVSACFLCRIFGLDDKLTASMIPKSVTTPIAMEVSSQLGGIVSVTVAAVVITGILGAMFSPLMIKIFKVRNRIAAGVAIGSCSHAVGTSKAIEIGEIEGAMSGVSIGISGIITVLIVLFL